MTTYLDEVLDTAELGRMLDEGFIQVRHHPDYPYAIYCYTKQAMFDRKWNHTTKTCRGLIVNEDTGEILARPFSKFFNLGEPDAPVFGHTDWVTVYDKLDGSLGIAYETPDGPAIATKGSFTSEQALKATELLRAKYPRYMHDDINTDLFEIIYPENRIVLNYGDEESLRYLGSVNIEDGDDYWNGILMKLWGIPRNSFVDSGPFYQLKLDLNRPNAEGYVLHNEYTGERLKVKQQDYLELHKVMTGLNERQIWEWMKDGVWIDDMLKDLPEELHDWTREVYNRILTKYQTCLDKMSLAYCDLIELKDDRKAFAKAAQVYDPLTRACLFLYLDNHSSRIYEAIWKAIRP